jgi:cytochrome c-type biogenesis protein
MIIAIDAALAFVAGLVSCFTPEALLLFPLFLAAIGADWRGSIVAIAMGLGLSLVLTGIAALGFDAMWLRRAICALLLLQGIALMNRSTVERFPLLTGGLSGVFADSGDTPARVAFRMTLLALFVGANWIPPAGPTLVRASLMAADARIPGPAFAILFVFGIGAAIPWIVLGRLVRFVLRPLVRRMTGGMGGKRLLGVSLLVVAVLGASGLDLTMAHRLDPLVPPWARKLALSF